MNIEIGRLVRGRKRLRRASWPGHGHRSPRPYRMPPSQTPLGERTRNGGRAAEVYGARRESVLRHPPRGRIRVQDLEPRSWRRASGRGGPTCPSPGSIVMPEIGNATSPVGAPARRASEPPMSRSVDGTGSVFGRTVSRNPTPPDRLSTSVRALRTERPGRNAGLDPVSHGRSGPGRRARLRRDGWNCRRGPSACRSRMHNPPYRQRPCPRQLHRGALRHTTHSGRRRCRCGRQRGCAIAACGRDPCLRSSWESRSAQARRKRSETPQPKEHSAGRSTITPASRRSRHPAPRSTTTRRSSRPSRTRLRCRPATAGWIGSAAIW